MDIKQIKQIIELMKRSELTEFSVEDEGFKLKIRRGGNSLPIVSQVAASTPPFPISTDTPIPVTPTAPAAALKDETPPAEEEGVSYIKSPMVGTFYTAASPETPPFAESGTKVTKSSVICIIEAMKIMNEIQAETKGTIIEVMVENGQPVEYGQQLFKIKES